MTLLEKLKSLFGKGGDGSTRPGGNDGVTVDTDATQSAGREAPPPMSSRDDAETESTERAAETDDTIEIEETPADLETDSADAESADEAPATEASAEAATETDDTDGTQIEEAESEPDVSDEPPIEEAEPDDGVAAESDAAGSTESISRVPDEDDGAAEQGEAVAPDETDAAPTAEKTTDDEPETTEVESEPVTEIKGIGSAYGDRLADAGVDSTLALAESEPEELAAETDISASRIQDWIDRANDR